MIDKTLEALERLMPLFEKSMRELVFTAEKAGEVTADMNTLRAAMAAPSAGPPAPIAGVTAIYCGWGCSCVTQCGDTYDYAGQPKPPLRPAAPAQPPAALETCQNCGDLPYPGCSSEFQGEPSCRFWPAAAPSVEAEPVRRLVDAAMAVISRHDEWVRQMPAGAFDDPLSVSLAALHDAAETVGISLDIVRRYAAPLQQPQEGWVSVEERMPDTDDEVLVWVASAHHRNGYAMLDSWYMHREDPTGMGGPTMEMGYMWRENDPAEVTHWMRIAAAPSQGEGEG